MLLFGILNTLFLAFKMPILVIKIPHFKNVIWNSLKVKHNFWHLNAIIWHFKPAFSVYEIDPRSLYSLCTRKPWQGGLNNRTHCRSSSIVLLFSWKLDRQNSTTVLSFCEQQVKVRYGLLPEIAGGRMVPWVVRGGGRMEWGLDRAIVTK